jgi:hypothetical protein
LSSPFVFINDKGGEVIHKEGGGHTKGDMKIEGDQLKFEAHK